MPLSAGDGSAYGSTDDPDALAAIARRLTLAGAPMTPNPTGGLSYTPPPPPPPDPFRFLAPVGNAVSAVGNAVGGAMQAAQDAPVLGGVLQGLGAVANQTIGPGLGLLEKTAGDSAAQQAFNTNYQTLGGDQPSPFDFFATTRALNAAHQASMSNAAATASDTSKSGLERALAGIQYGADQVAQNTLPVPGLGLGGDVFGSLARRVGGFGRVAEDAASAAGRDSNVVRPIFGDVAQAARNSEAVRSSGRFQFTAPDAAPTDFHAPTDVAAPTADLTAPTPGRYSVVQHAPDTFQVVSRSGGDGPVFSTANGFKGDPQAAAQAQADRMNAGATSAPTAPTAPATAPATASVDAARQAALAKASKDFLNASGMTENPKPTGFGTPGTAFHGQDIGQIVRTIKATTPYRSFQDFGAAVRSGASDTSGAPQNLIDLFKRGEAERAGSKWTPTSTPADVTEAKAAAASGTVPGTTPVAGTPKTGPGIGFHDVIPQKNGLFSVTDQTGRVISHDMAPKDAQIAAAKANLADRMGVDANTGRPLTGGARPPDALTPGGPPQPPSGLTMAKVARGAENITGVGKTLTTAASPFHFMFRHALPEMGAHPIAALTGSIKGLGEGFRMSPQDLALRQNAMRADPLTHDYGLYIGRPHGGIVGGEEAVPSTFLNRLPVLGKIIERSGQGFVQGLNEVRYEVAKSVDGFSQAMADRGLTAPMTSADKTRMGETINTFTGRGVDTRNMGEAGKTITRALNVPMFSPQLAAARVKMLGYTAKGLADVAHNVALGRPVDAVALERARLGIGAMVGVGGLYMLMSGIGGKLDTNPTSATAGQVDMGKPSPNNGLLSLAASETGVGASAYPGKNVMLNPTESESTLLRTIARLAVSIHNEATTGKGGAFGAGPPQSPMDVGTKYLISQLFSSPITYPIAEFLQGFPVTPLDSVLPMPVTAALTGSGTQLPTIGGKAPKGGTYNGPPSAPRENFRFTAPGKTTTGSGSGTTGTFRFQAPPKFGGNTGGTGSHMPAPISGGDIPSVIQNTARSSGIDPNLALAVAQQESGFDPNAVGDNGNSYGLFQENVVGRGAGRAPDLNPVGQTQRFAADVRQFMAQNPNASPGQVAAAVQRPANPAQYAASVDALYRRLAGQ